MNAFEIAGALVAVLGVATALVLAGRAWLRLRGPRLVTCPETQAPVTVEVDVGHALAARVLGGQPLRLRECSRWPERAGCGQECLREVADAPDGCLIREILGTWYADKSCAYCGHAIGVVHWHDHRPALRSPEGRLREWADIAHEQLRFVLASHSAVCWNCFMAESFRHDHPDLVVDRPRHPDHYSM
jgi:hypothetical protein